MTGVEVFCFPRWNRGGTGLAPILGKILEVHDEGCGQGR